MPDSFATPDQAAGYGYALPAAQAGGLLARASQAIRDAAGFSVLSEDITITRRAGRGFVPLPVPLVTAVASVSQDGTALEAAAWDWEPRPDTVAGGRIRLGHGVQGRRDGEFAVTLTHGLTSVPDSLVMLTSAVACRLAASPAGMAAGITSQSVGSVSWSAAGGVPPQDALTSGEEARLAGIVPLARAWMVPL